MCLSRGAVPWYEIEQTVVVRMNAFGRAAGWAAMGENEFEGGRGEHNTQGGDG